MNEALVSQSIQYTRMALEGDTKMKMIENKKNHLNHSIAEDPRGITLKVVSRRRFLARCSPCHSPTAACYMCGRDGEGCLPCGTPASTAALLLLLLLLLLRLLPDSGG